MPDPPGAVFLAEIREQPHALRALLEHDADFARVAATARERGTSVVRMVGHGSSDNAASYGVYAFGLLPRWTALRDSITLTAYYDAQLELRGSTVVALSQSGRTPDVIDYVTRARRAGAYTVALTNDPGSDLASEADDVLPLEAGPENAVAASKTYLNQVAAEPLTATDLAHGPVAALDPLFPVWTIASEDQTLPAVVEAAERVRLAGATLVASGDAADKLAGAAYALPVPSPPSPLLSPLLSVVPGQLFALELARAKGLDPDRPEGLTKVTLAR
jgi:glucosamine--fructose-6-phosphate aminotransferase (isomerizing)